MDNDLLSRHHADLDRRIAVLVTKADGGDGPALALAWGHFERDLLGHFQLEEHELFDRFALEHPDEVTALKQDHEALRRDLLALGIRADLHCLRAEAVRGFVADLRAHAAREEQALYRWAKTDVEGDTWTRIARGLREAGETFGRKVADEVVRLASREL